MAPQHLVDDVMERLRQAGNRTTAVRRLTVAALLDSTGHVTAEELESRVRAEHPYVSRSTIYRLLDDLERLGIVDHVSIDRGPAMYHLADGAHHHLVCQDCGTATEVPAAAFATPKRTLETRYRFTMGPSHLAVLGRCSSGDGHGALARQA